MYLRKRLFLSCSSLVALLIGWDISVFAVEDSYDGASVGDTFVLDDRSSEQQVYDDDDSRDSDYSEGSDYPESCVSSSCSVSSGYRVSSAELELEERSPAESVDSRCASEGPKSERVHKHVTAANYNFEPAETQNCRGEDLKVAWLLGEMLEAFLADIDRANGNHYPDKSIVLSHHRRFVSPSALMVFLKKVLDVSDESLLAGFFHIENLLTRQVKALQKGENNRRLLHLSRQNIILLMLASLRTASKYYDDFTYPNASWAFVAGMPLADFNRLEIMFLWWVRFELFISHSELLQYGRQITARYFYRHVERHAGLLNGVRRQVYQSLLPVKSYSPPSGNGMKRSAACENLPALARAAKKSIEPHWVLVDLAHKDASLKDLAKVHQDANAWKRKNLDEELRPEEVMPSHSESRPRLVDWLPAMFCKPYHAEAK